MIRSQEEKLKQLSVRILKQDSYGRYAHQGSGFLYIADDDHAYILTAAHVLKEFKNTDQIVTECYPDKKHASDLYPEQYIFRVSRKDVWTYSKKKTETTGFHNPYDVAVLPLCKAENPCRDWMKNRVKAYFIRSGYPLENLRALGYGYPGYEKEAAAVHLCTSVNENICCHSYTEADHRTDWECTHELKDIEREGLSGSMLAVFDARAIILTAIVQKTPPQHAGKKFIGSDLSTIRNLLAKHHVPIREIDPDPEQRAFRNIERIEAQLVKDCQTCSPCADSGKEIPDHIKERFRQMLAAVLGFPLDPLFSPEANYGNRDQGLAVRITASAAETMTQQMLNEYAENLGQEYPRLLLIALETNANHVAMPRVPDGVAFSQDDVWDISRLIEKISELDCRQIATLCEFPASAPAAVSPPEYPRHRLRSSPALSALFIPESRATEIDRFLDQLKEKKVVFISGVGGIGKTQLAIHLAQRLNPEKGTYFLEYVVSPPDEHGKVMEGMKATILNANFSNHSRDGRSDDDDYQVRVGYLRDEYSNALLIVDNFDWPGRTLSDLRNETSYKDLTDNEFQVIFTTRSPLDPNLGTHSMCRISKLADQHLLALMEKYNLPPGTDVDDLKEIIDFVDGHTLSVELIAQTLNAGKGRISIADIRRLLEDGPKGLRPFPKIRHERNGRSDPDTLYGHLRKLFSPDSLSAEEKAILCCAVLIPRSGLDLQCFDSCINPDFELDEHINQLVDLGWIIKDDARWLVRMEPVICCICKNELEMDMDFCKRFLDNLLEQYQSLNLVQADQMNLAECFETAAKLARDHTYAEKWRGEAASIRSEYEKSKTDQRQEVGV